MINYSNFPDNIFIYFEIINIEIIKKFKIKIDLYITNRQLEILKENCILDDEIIFVFNFFIFSLLFIFFINFILFVKNKNKIFNFNV